MDTCRLCTSAKNDYFFMKPQQLKTEKGYSPMGAARSISPSISNTNPAVPTIDLFILYLNPAPPVCPEKPLWG
ncbi:hypothetical protein XELAEV_18045892mg [Xenopus laevis]|uniref:Uncharacterized protein n=1 Tax=Xenopus laevis TaxID=8355 RepID=A0A974BS43_XENLA|nr:hypothetical protein XELAEV_18045892mg [Xenopus laevis]